MLDKKTLLSNNIKQISNLLDTKYSAELNFRNHCYLRIAYDNTVGDKWDNKVNKPFIKYASEELLEKALSLLNNYTISKEDLLADNERSLLYRRMERKIKTVKPKTLF